MKASTGQADILYQEWVPAGLFVRVLVFGALVPIVVVLLVFLLMAPASENVIGLTLAGVVLVGLLAVFWNYRGIRIVVTRDAFEARYGLLNRTRIPLDAVQECHPDVSSFRRYWGIGVRFGTDGSFAYTTSFGPAVRIRRATGRPFVVSTRQPQALCAAMQEGMRLRGAASGK